MNNLCNELSKFFSARSTHRIYSAVAIIELLMVILLPFKQSDLILGSAISMQGLIGAFFGVLNVFLAGIIWEPDLGKGTIINVLSAGTGRTKYFFTKLFAMLIQSFLFTALISVIGFSYALIVGKGFSDFTGKDILIANICSFTIVFLVSFVFELLAACSFLIFTNFAGAMVVASVISFAEFVVSTNIAFRNGAVFSPSSVFANTIRNINVETLTEMIKRGSFVLGVYIFVLGFCGGILNERNEY